MTIICPECKNKNNDSNKFCEYCGSNFPQIEKKDFSSVVRNSKDTIKENIDNAKEEKFCPNCNKYLRESSSFCPNCGYKFTKDLNYPLRNSEVLTCPHCNNKNNLDAEFCGNCGKDLPLVTEMEIIECPECGNLVRDDVNFCRYCAHRFSNLSFVSKDAKRNIKKILWGKSHLVNNNIIYCQNCGELHRGNVSNYCTKCGTPTPIGSWGYAQTKLNHEKYQKILVNDIFIPLSYEYNVNFRKTTLSEYFDITPDEESHILYVIMNKLIEDDSSFNVVNYFKSCLDELDNRNNIEEELLKETESFLYESFQNDGIEASLTASIKDSYYKTIETPTIESKHGGFTKGVATLGFGLVGLAATSGVKQTTAITKILEKGEYIHNNINLNKNNIIVKSYVDNNNVASFQSINDKIEKVVFQWQDIDFIDDEYYFIFNSGESLKCPIPDLKEWISKSVMKLLATQNPEKNQRLINEWNIKLQTSVLKLFLKLLREHINKHKNSINNNSTPENSSDNNGINELEKIVEMYEKGLLTDEEFVAMKNKIIRE